MEADHIRTGGRPDQHRAAGARLDQNDTAQDQRAHDPLAELGFGDQQRTLARGRDQQGHDVGLGARIDQRRAAGELTDLRQEFAWPLLDDRQHMTQAVAPADSDSARYQDEHAEADFSSLEQQRSLGITLHSTEPANPVDLLQSELGKHLLAARVDRCHDNSVWAA